MPRNFYVALCVLLLSGTPALAVQQYEVINLGSLGGGGTRGLAINALGQVTGESSLSNGSTRAIITAPGNPIDVATSDLGTLGGQASYGRGINAAGQVTGNSYVADLTNQHAFRTAPGAPINSATDDLGVFGGTKSFAEAINASGQVTGNYIDAAGFNRAYRTTATGGINAAADIGTLAGGTSSTGWAINTSGQVAGTSGTSANNGAHVFRTAPNAPINPITDDVGQLVAGRSSIPNGINDSGAIAGQGLVSQFFFHAFFTPGDRAILPSDDLGTLGGEVSGALALNNLNWVVGASTVKLGDGEDDAHAFIWYGSGPLIDLNSLIPADSGWVLRQAEGINDAGQITGFGYFNGVRAGFLLSPVAAVPEPASLSALSLVGFSLFLRPRRGARL